MKNARSEQHRYLADPKDGPLPALLLILTVVSGVMDAVSILSLGHVFVANMTGNVVFIGFAIVGTPGFSLLASLAALVGFVVGGVLVGAVIKRHRNRTTLLRNVVAVQAVLFAGVAALMLVGVQLSGASMSMLAAVVAVSMGMQNAAARHAAVAGMTTTVLTMTITGIVSDLGTGRTADLPRRLLPVLAMLVGAAVGALLVIRLAPAAGMVTCVVLTALVAAVLTVLARKPAPWMG